LLGVEPLCLAISGKGHCFCLYRCAPWCCRWRSWVRPLLQCEVSRGSGDGGFFSPVARLQCEISMACICGWSMRMLSACPPFGYIEPSGVGVALGGALPFDYGGDPRVVWVLHPRLLKGVSAAGGTHASCRLLGHARPFGYTLDAVVRCIVWSRLRVSLQLHRWCSVASWVSAVLSRSILLR
jgi:hypothetical protein